EGGRERWGEGEDPFAAQGEERRVERVETEPRRDEGQALRQQARRLLLGRIRNGERLSRGSDDDDPQSVGTSPDALADDLQRILEASQPVDETLRERVRARPDSPLSERLDLADRAAPPRSHHGKKRPVDVLQLPVE